MRALDSDEAATWVAELLSLEGDRRTTSHSFKATLLSYAAKRGLAHQDRLVMGHHVQEAKMADQYSRDAAARPLRLVQNLLREIRLTRFFPDASRAGRVVKAVREEGAVGGTDADRHAHEGSAQGPVEVVESPSSSSASEGTSTSGETEEGRALPEKVTKTFEIPKPPEGFVFKQHRKLRTLHLLSSERSHIFECGRVLSGTHQDPTNLRYDTPVCSQCHLQHKADR